MVFSCGLWLLNCHGDASAGIFGCVMKTEQTGLIVPFQFVLTQRQRLSVGHRVLLFSNLIMNYHVYLNKFNELHFEVIKNMNI